jgi:hypothetical protein
MERLFHKISSFFVGAASLIASPISASLVFCFLDLVFLSTSFILASELLV